MAGVAPSEEGAVDGYVKRGGGCVTCGNGHDAVCDFDRDGCFPVFEFGVSPCPESSLGIDVEAVMGTGGEVMSVFGGGEMMPCAGRPDVGLSHQNDDGDQAGDCKRDGKKPVTHGDAPDLLETCSLKNNLMKDKAFFGFFVCFWERFEYFFTDSKK